MATEQAPLHVRQILASVASSGELARPNTSAVAAPQEVLRRLHPGQAAPTAQQPPKAVPSTGAPAPEPEYLPRSQLTAAPKPFGDVAIPFPQVEGMVDLRVQLALFIDASGRVRRIRLDTPNVPPVFAQAIHEALLAARFIPGKLDAVPVASQIRIEVEFGAWQGQ